MEETRAPRHYKVVIEPDEDGVFIATVPSVPGVAEQGESVDEAFDICRAPARREPKAQ